MSLTNPLTRLPLLRPVPIFRGLSKGALLEVARKSTEVTYPPGSSIVEQGDAGDLLCIIVEGTVEVRRDGRSVAQMAAGSYFGEISLIDGRPRSATIVAIDDVVLLTLSSADFDSLLNTPYVARSALKGLATLFRELQASQEQDHG